MSIASIITQIQKGLLSQRTSAQSLIIIPIDSIPFQVEDIAIHAGITIKDISLKLAEQLLPLSNSERQLVLNENLKQMVSELKTDVVYLNKIEIIFETTLNINPLMLLKNAAKIKPLIVFWPGIYHNGYLSYAEPNHPEYQSYSQQDLKDVFIVTSDIENN